MEILSDSWTFLVLREAFFGRRRFDEFRVALRVARSTLANRLARLVRWNLLTPIQYSAKPPRKEFRLTELGLDLYSSFVVLMQWGDKWLQHSGKKPPLILHHNPCGQIIDLVTVCSGCAQPVVPWRVTYRDGPGSGLTPAPSRKRSRRPSEPELLSRIRPCNVANTLKIIGDRWSFLVIREAFFGVRRFDEFQESLGIASNILSDRLRRLVTEGIFQRSKYQVRPDRYEYRLTEKGRDLYIPLIVMMRWGDRWLSHGTPPLRLRHRNCDKDFTPVVVCNRCGMEIKARDISYTENYRLHVGA